jgi:hypothetical protein
MARVWAFQNVAALASGCDVERVSDTSVASGEDVGSSLQARNVANASDASTRAGRRGRAV